MQTKNIKRRHDIDCLRVLAFVVLIFYHIGMYYVADWGWHIKSNYQSENLQYLMLLVNQWRMPLLFFISGSVLCLVENKISPSQLLGIRFLRLIVPLLVGMYLVVPPQAYYEAIQKYAYTGSYLSFWIEYTQPSSPLLPQMQHGSLGLLTWNHLWFLVYLWVYTLVYIFTRRMFLALGYLTYKFPPSSTIILLAPIITLTIFGLWLKPLFPKTHALFDDWYNHGVYFTVFLLGYLACKSDTIWRKISVHRPIWLGGAITCYLIIILVNNLGLIKIQGPALEALFQVCVYANVWLWILSITGFASVYLNKPSALLNYFNEAILPCYVLHQTVIIVIAIQLRPYQLGGAIEALYLCLATVVICALLYSLIRQWSFTRISFGLKAKSNS